MLWPLFILLLAPVKSEVPLGVRDSDRFSEYSAVDYSDLEDGENRFLFTSTSTVSVNSTLLRAIGAIVGALLLALPLYLAYATAGSAGSGGSGGSGYGNHYRRKRDDGEEDLASHMYILTRAFRKFHIDDLSCQFLVACEAGKHENRTHQDYGPLTTKVHRILSTTAIVGYSDPNAVSSQYVNDLLLAHNQGQSQGSSCKNLYGSSCPMSM